MKILAFLILLIPLPSFGQTAKVIQLTDEEAAQAKSLYAQKTDVDAKISALRDHVTKKYFPGINSCTTEWTDGKRHAYCEPYIAPSDFEFSEDFRFVVPKPTPAPAQAWPSNYPYIAPINDQCPTCVSTIPIAGGLDAR